MMRHVCSMCHVFVTSMWFIVFINSCVMYYVVCKKYGTCGVYHVAYCGVISTKCGVM